MKNMDLQGATVSVTGGTGFLGGFVAESIARAGARVHALGRGDYDLGHRTEIDRMLADLRPDAVVHLAAVVGGIGANRGEPGRFFYENATMGIELLEACRVAAVPKVVVAGTVCAYPKHCPVPFREDDLWTGYPEETNAPYGVAKKAAMVMLDGYRRQYGLRSACVLPVNLYGPRDNFDLQTSHVIPALIRKCVEARRRGEREIPCWGTGSASREFLFVEDAAEAIVRATECIDDPAPINLGTGREISIKDLTELIMQLSGFEGQATWDSSKPDGQPRRCLDIQRAERLLGWRASTTLEDGLRRTIEWYRSNGA